jgi:hypothetical protein
MRVYKSCRTKEGTGDSTKTDGGRTTQKRPSHSRSKKEQETARTIRETPEKKTKKGRASAATTQSYINKSFYKKNIYL